MEDEALTLEPLSAVTVEPRTLRQIFNDTDADALWLVVGAPREGGNTLEMSEATLARAAARAELASPNGLLPLLGSQAEG